jgi:hypothetical protein
MIAEQPNSPPGLPLTINFKILPYWTPEQALAVFQLLDDRELRTTHFTAWRRRGSENWFSDNPISMRT